MRCRLPALETDFRWRQLDGMTKPVDVQQYQILAPPAYKARTAKGAQLAREGFRSDVQLACQYAVTGR
ncbi:hypothetical protein D3C87_2066190 [compost metagenome]